MKQHLLFLDFETAYDSLTFTLNSKRKGAVSILEYVRDSRFRVFGAGIAFGDCTPRWLPATPRKDPLDLILQGFFDRVSSELGWENVAVVGHNLKFDGMILKERYGVVPGLYIDTLGMSKAALGKTVKGHGLQALSEHFGLTYNGVIGKGEMHTDGKFELTADEEELLAAYCLGDVDLTRQLFNKLAPEFPENQYAVLHQTISMFIQTPLKLDVPMLEKLSKEESERRIKIFEEINDPIVDAMIPEKARAKWDIDKTLRATDIKKVFSSNAKFPRLLSQKGYDVPTKKSPNQLDESGEPKMIPALALGDTGFLALANSPNEELQGLCEARIAAKSTMLETRSGRLLKIGRTGQWSFDVQFSGADQTHRFSGGAGAGGNPQQFTNPKKVKDPKKRAIAELLRGSVAAPDGRELVVGDFSQIEFRIVAFLSKDPGLVQAIERNVDIYCDSASVYYGRLITKKDDKERGFGKQMILGLGYQMGWAKFQHTVLIQAGMSITEEEARKAVDLYRTRYGGVKVLWDVLNNAISWMAEPEGSPTHRLTSVPVTFGHECVILPSGLKIRFPNLRQVPSKKFKGQMEWVYDVWNDGHIETRKLYGGKLLENISQAIAGEICKEAMMRVQNVVLQVHDELGVLCKRGLGFVTQQHLKRAMTISPKWLPQIKLDAEVHVGRSWAEAK